jgi:hypothetical protein
MIVEERLEGTEREHVWKIKDLKKMWLVWR